VNSSVDLKLHHGLSSYDDLDGQAMGRIYSKMVPTRSHSSIDMWSNWRPLSLRGRTAYSNGSGRFNKPLETSTRGTISSSSPSAFLTFFARTTSTVAKIVATIANREASATCSPGQMRRPKPYAAVRGSRTFELGLRVYVGVPSSATEVVRIRKRSGLNVSGSG
jgi:hypothetical protein